MPSPLPPSDFEIRENRDLWHCSPNLPYAQPHAQPAVYGQPSPLRQPMPSPFAPPIYGFAPPPAEQIQNAYALTPNGYGHGTPLGVQMELMAPVEALDIAAPAQPDSGHQDAVRMLSDFDPFRGYGQKQEVPPRHSKQQRRGHSSSSSTSARHRGSDTIRESDVPPRFRKRKKADSVSFRAKDWRNKEHRASFGQPPHGSWNQSQCLERTSIHQLMMKHNGQ